MIRHHRKRGIHVFWKFRCYRNFHRIEAWLYKINSGKFYSLMFQHNLPQMMNIGICLFRKIFGVSGGKTIYEIKIKLLEMLRGYYIGDIYCISVNNYQKQHTF